jgi:hypothetical protein
VAGDHGAHAFRKSGENDHGDVYQKKQDQEIGYEEMQGAGSLMAAENGDKYRKYRGNCRGHREAAEDHEGEKKDEHGYVRNPLEYIVGLSFILCGPLQMQMV